MANATWAESSRCTFQLKDGVLSALAFGDPGRPVDIVFAHANGFNAETYRSVLAPLGTRFRILAIDQRGHGLSTLPAEPKGRRSWRDLQADLAALIDQLPGDRVILSGHSMGAAASIMAAAIRPDRVKALVLFDPVVLPWLISLQAQLPGASPGLFQKMPIAARARARRDVFPDREAVIAAYRGRGAFKSWPDEILSDYVAGGVRDRADGGVELACAPAWEASNFSAMANNIWSLAARVRAPMTIFRAAHGSTCRIGDGRLFLRGNRGAAVTTVAGASHFLPMERPELVREALTKAASEG
jgi:pimeloyl-ACP methyl ester carboxylesterase